MKVKKGDKVKILSGKDRGKVSEIITAFPRTNKVLVKGVNIATKHQKAKNESRPAGRIKFELPLDVSNVQVLDPVSGKPARVGYSMKDGKKERVYRVGKLTKVEKAEKKSKVETTETKKVTKSKKS